MEIMSSRLPSPISEDFIFLRVTQVLDFFIVQMAPNV